MWLAGPLRPLLRWPSAANWRQSAIIALAGFACLSFAAAFAPTMRIDPQSLTIAMAGMAAFLFMIPSFGEELLFRWLLFPRFGLRLRAPLAGLSLALFVLWHPAQFMSGFGPAWSQTFVEPSFLICVSILGLTLTAIRWRSESLWPCVFTHWIAICVWKFALGGPA